MTDTHIDFAEHLRERYAASARIVAAGESCCGPDCCGDDGTYGSVQYSPDEKAALPGAAVLASLGCGNPVAVAELRAGDTVLDLGCGGGIDVLLSAQRVGATGRAIGIDLTDEMVLLAKRTADEAGVPNAEFVTGGIEELPLPDASVDVVISNCVVNLSTDKPAVFREVARVLRPGGRFRSTDVVADGLTGGRECDHVAGALSVDGYRTRLTGVGLVDVEITLTHAVEGGMHSAIIKADKPA